MASINLATVFAGREKDKREVLQLSCPELRNLPEDWDWRVSPENGNRIYFLKYPTKTETTWTHPTHGALPEPWELRVVKTQEKTYAAWYYNPETNKYSKSNPRSSRLHLQTMNAGVPKDLRIAGAVTRLPSGSSLEGMKRCKPLDYDIRDQYSVVHTIDDGAGGKGGMNSGIYVVKLKANPSRVYIEKHFAGEKFTDAQSEIEMMYRVKHCGLAMYIAAFIINGPNPRASVYIEFCDRGDLDSVIKQYMNRPSAVVPESFVWHCLLALTEALAYLQGGFQATQTGIPDPNWMPIIHRDMKPDNILFRSRSTLGSKKHFYCIISDFGLAVEEPGVPGNPKVFSHMSGAHAGTFTWFAPELCHDPYPTTTAHRERFPAGQRHTAKSDLWSLAASIACLVHPIPAEGLSPQFKAVWSHLDIRANRGEALTNDWDFWAGKMCRRRKFHVPKIYTRALREGIDAISEFEPDERMHPMQALMFLRELIKGTKFVTYADNEGLPDWATRVHEYHGKAALEEARSLMG